MTREEEKYKAATESWGKQGFKNQEQKIPYKLGFLEGFDYANQHPREGLWDAEKVIEWLNVVDFSKYVKNLSVVYVGRLKDDLIKAMEN